MRIFPQRRDQYYIKENHIMIKNELLDAINDVGDYNAAVFFMVVSATTEKSYVTLDNMVAQYGDPRKKILNALTKLEQHGLITMIK